MIVNGTNVSMIRGDSESIHIKRYDINDFPINFENGDTVYFTVKEKPTDSEVLIQKIVQNFNDGSAIIYIDPQDTKNLKFKKYCYDIQLTKGSGEVTTLVPPSDFAVQEEVTWV